MTPVQINQLPNTPSSLFQVPGPQGANNAHINKTASANQPFTIRLAQATTPQSIVNNTPTTLGFDSQTYSPTYKAISGQIYSLRFTGSGTYPFTNTIVPVFGYYDIKCSWVIDSSTGGLAGSPIIQQTSIWINGAVRTTAAFVQLANEGAGTSGMVFDTLELNPNDSLSIVVIQLNSNSAALPTVAYYTATFLTIRYLGLV